MELEGLEIKEEALVYRPAEDSFLAIKAINALNNLSEPEILDIGTGSGILGLYAAMHFHAKKLVMSDISKRACALAERNYILNKDKLSGTNVTILKSDLFENIKGKYDLIIFNAPYLRGSIDAHLPVIERAWNGGPTGIEIALRFLNEASSHLKKNGAIILLASSLSDIDTLRKKIDELGYRIKSELKEHYFFEDIIAMIILKNKKVNMHDE
jgi:release factor glutamine methyltransferase